MACRPRPPSASIMQRPQPANISAFSQRSAPQHATETKAGGDVSVWHHENKCVNTGAILSPQTHKIWTVSHM